MDPIELIERATEHTAKIANGVKAEHLDKPTPCSEFDVRGLLNHMLGGLTMLATAAETGTAKPPEGDQVTGDVGAEYASRREKVLQAWRAPGVLEKTLTMPFGAMPGQMMAGIAFMEHLLHGWDLAKATGQDSTLPEELAKTCLEQLRPMGEMWRMPGVFGPEVQCPDGASITDQLVAFAGRTP